MLMSDKQVIDPQYYSTSPYGNSMYLDERDNGTKNLEIVSKRSQGEYHYMGITGRQILLN